MFIKINEAHEVRCLYWKINLHTAISSPLPDQYQCILQSQVICQYIDEILLFQILSDKEKKQHFDLYGTTTQPRNGQKQGSPFFDPHSGFSFFFNGMPFQNSWSRPGQIDYRTYYKTVLPMSSEKPYLIKFIADWCFACE